MLRHGARLPGLLQPAGWLASGQSTGLLQQCQACASGNLGTGSSLGEVASCSYSTDGPRSVRGAQQQRQRPRDGNKQSSASIKQASAGRDDGAGEGSRAITPAAAEVRGELASRGDAPLRTRNMVVQADVDLAMENAPAQVLELIGDPRSGVADDVTRNSFGSVTVDMVHHQASNEVYWYKYEFAGEASREAHRDARLSEYSKNLMYLLRAKDPKHWTIDALARKFRVRKQRVMAILALKEMEGHAMEQGAMLSGPLAAYACPVRLEDLPLSSAGTGKNRGTGREPPASLEDRLMQEADTPRMAAAGDAPPARMVLSQPAPSQQQGQGQSEGGVDLALLPMQNALPRAAFMAQHVQKQLLEALAPYGYDLGALRAQVLAGLDEAAASLPQPAAAAAGGAAGAEGKAEGAPAEAGGQGAEGAAAAAAADPAAAVAAAIVEQRKQVEALLDALEAMLLQRPAIAAPAAGSAAGAGSAEGAAAAAGAGGAAAPETGAAGSAPTSRPYASWVLEEERAVVAATKSLQAAVDAWVKAGGAASAGAGSGAQAALASALEGLLPSATAAGAGQGSGASSSSGSEGRLLRAVLGLSLPARKALVQGHAPTAAALNAFGVDLTALTTRSDYQGPAAQRTAGEGSTSGSSVMGMDVLGFEAIGEAEYLAVASALAALERAGAQAVQQASGSTAATSSSTTTSSTAGAASALLGELASLSNGYRSALGAVRRLEADLAGSSTAVTAAVDEAGQQQQKASAAAPASGSLLGGADVGEQEGLRTAAAKVMAEAGGKALLDRVQLVEALAQLRKAGDAETAQAMEARVRQAAGQPPAPSGLPAAVLAQAQAAAWQRAAVPEGTPPGELQAAERAVAGASATASWDALAAWLDARPGGRRFHRGSGERHRARLPTYPEFEGYPLEALEGVEEGEVSGLNRAVAAAEEEQAAARFKRDLLFNLGLRGERVHDASKRRMAPNLRADPKLAPIVLYDIAQDGSTVYPPRCVIERDGSQRALNETERVWQERRKAVQEVPLPYQVQRVRRKPELI